MSRSRNTARSTGVRFSSRTRNAIDTVSSTSIRRAGSAISSAVINGSGNQAPTYRSRRTRAERRWSIASLVVTVEASASGDRACGAEGPTIRAKAS
jgi:hypothetical protein